LAEPDLDLETDLPETTRVSLYLLSLIQADKEAFRSASPVEPELHDFDYYPDSVYSDPPLLGEPWPEPPPPPDRSAATRESEFPPPPHDPSVPLPPLRKLNPRTRFAQCGKSRKKAEHHGKPPHRPSQRGLSKKPPFSPLCHRFEQQKALVPARH
ncbi:MAG: hypothetical protein U0984_07515, partial [Prosthecobacter sp.]|nr:hypothetical protein [Prosthecobacter sp.]